MRRIHPTEDGSLTIYDSNVNEYYHSSKGAETESMHVFINNGLKNFKNQQIRILEIGYGTGMNAILTYLYHADLQVSVAYYGVDAHPPDKELWEKLGLYKKYPDILGIKDAFIDKWGEALHLSDSFTLYKSIADAASLLPNSTFHLIYMDAFSPEKQPQLWSPAFFRRIFHIMEPGGILVSYSVKGSVKQALRASGFEVKRLPGPPGKRHMLQAIKAC